MHNEIPKLHKQKKKYNDLGFTDKSIQGCVLDYLTSNHFKYISCLAKPRSSVSYYKMDRHLKVQRESFLKI